MKPSLIFLSFLLLTSCIEELDMPEYIFVAQHTMNVIVKGGEEITVFLFENERIGGGELRPILNAEVSIWSEGNVIGHVINGDNGVYETEVEAEFNKSYEIKAVINEVDTLSAQVFVPNPPVLISATHIPIAGFDDEGSTYPGVKVEIERQSVELSYYEVIIWLYQYDEFHPAELYNLKDSIVIREGLPIALFTDEGIKDDLFSVLITYTTTSHSGNFMKLYPFIVELRAVTEEYFHYRRSFYLNENSQEELEPGLVNSPVDLYSNVKGGAGRAVSFSSVVSELISVD